jgi:hypothetical protein
MYSTNLCIATWSFASIRTELSTLNPECFQIDLLFVEQELKYIILPDLNRAVFPGFGDMHEVTGFRKNTFTDDSMHMAMPVNQISKSLYRSNHSRDTTGTIDFKRIEISYRFPCRTAEFSQ